MDKSEFYRDARRDLSGPLDGIRVIDATTSWAGPMCACILADLGADVVKVEAHDGEVMRRVPPALPGHDDQIGYAFATVNRNKRSLTLDLHSDEGHEVFLKLAARSDIIVQNFKPGTFEHWRIGYEQVRAVKPDIIYVSISGYGQFGPLHERVAYDTIAQAMGGFLSINGSPDGPPTKSPTWLCDDLGGLHGAIGALAALRHRDVTGEGQHIDVAMLDAMLFQSNGNLTLGAMDLEVKRWGNQFPFSVPANTYKCRDGLVMAGVLLDTHWKTMAKMAGRDDLADNPEYGTMAGRINHREECDGMFAKWCESRTVEEVVEECAKHGIACSKVRTYAEAARCPNTFERDMLQQVPQHDGKPAPITGPAAKFSRTPTRIRNGAPALGAHTDDILEELGYDAEARRRLRESRVI